MKKTRLRAWPALLLGLAALAPTRAAAEEGAPLALVGFSKNSRQVLLRPGAGADRAPLLLSRTGNPLKAPRGDREALERRYRHGTPLEGDGQLLRARGISLRLDPERQKLSLGKGGRWIPLRLLGLKGSCTYRSLAGAMLSRDRRVVAALLGVSCEAGDAEGSDPKGPPTGGGRTEPRLVYLPALARKLMSRGAALARKGRYKEATAALDLADLLGPGSLKVVYLRAQAAALAADQARALRWLGKLKTRASTTARQYLVKAKFDPSFRLIKDSAGFKRMTEL